MQDPNEPNSGTTMKSSGEQRASNLFVEYAIQVVLHTELVVKFGLCNENMCSQCLVAIDTGADVRPAFGSGEC